MYTPRLYLGQSVVETRRATLLINQKQVRPVMDDTADRTKAFGPPVRLNLADAQRGDHGLPGGSTAVKFKRPYDNPSTG